MQAILSVTESLKIKELALPAEKIAEILVNENNVCTITPVTKLPKHETNDDKLLAAISILTDRIGRLEARGDNAHDHDRNNNNNNYNRNRSNTNDSSRNRSPSSTRSQNNKLCYYHEKFRQAARLCNIGCEWRNRSATCTLTDVCIHHARYKERAFSCLEGCKFFAEHTKKSTTIPKN